MTKQTRREEILRSARSVFAHKGYHQAGVSDIIKRAGIARGTFYLYFTGKRAIFGTLLDDLLEELDDRIRPVELGPGRPPPLDQVRENLRRVLELVVHDPETMQLILHQATALDGSSRSALKRFYDHLLGMIDRSLSHGIKLGIVRQCDTRVVSLCILGSIKEVVDRLALGGKAPDLGIMAEQILQYGLNGILRAH